MILDIAKNGKHTAMILFYLQTAFHTLDHKTWLDKIKYIGFIWLYNKMASLLSHK